MSKNKWFWLQLFAGEGAGASGGEGGGDGAVSGDNGLAAEDQRLLELGVPEEKLRKRAKRASAKLPEGAVRTAPKPAQEQEPHEQVATAEENPTEETKTDAPKRMTWDEIMADPEYNKEMQATVQSRLRSAKAAEESLSKLTPVLELLAKRHGLDAANMDYDALAKAINDDDVYYEDMALEQGKSLAEVKRDDQAKREANAQQRAEDRTLEEQKFRDHIMSLERQGEALRKVFPKFDLRTELQNPTFARMTSIGISVEDAYHAVHRKEIDAARSQVIAQQTMQKASNAIQAGSRRPDESGTSGQSASVTTFDYSKASRQQREALKQQIRAAAARGEKLYPGR